VKPVRWEIIRPAQILAVVEAPDKDSALRVAAERLNLRLVDLSRPDRSSRMTSRPTAMDVR
jgi:hypothetical protein